MPGVPPRCTPRGAPARCAADTRPGRTGRPCTGTHTSTGPAVPSATGPWNTTKCGPAGPPRTGRGRGQPGGGVRIQLSSAAVTVPLLGQHGLLGDVAERAPATRRPAAASRRPGRGPAGRPGHAGRPAAARRPPSTGRAARRRPARGPATIGGDLGQRHVQAAQQGDQAGRVQLALVRSGGSRCPAPPRPGAAGRSGRTAAAPGPTARQRRANSPLVSRPSPRHRIRRPGRPRRTPRRRRPRP